MNINYELLRTFLEVGCSPTFAAAAARRNITPSAVSQQVKTLETQLGVQLFERIGRRVRLSDAGRALLSVLDPHLGAIDECLRELGEAKNEVRGTLALGAPRAFARYWLRPRLITLLEIHDQLLVDVHFGGPTALRRMLVEGNSDFCILVEEPEHPMLEFEPIYVEEFVAVASPHYLTKHGKFETLAEFSSGRYVVFDADLPMHAHWWRTHFGSREWVAPPLSARVGSLDEMLALACAGIGISILPSYLVTDSLDAGALVQLSPAREEGASDLRQHARNTIYLAWRKDAAHTPRFTAVRSALLADSESAISPSV